MRSLPLAGAVLLLALAGCDNSQGQDDQSVAYRETVRCYNAAADYAQQFVVSGSNDEAMAMMGYSAELRGKAYALGARIGKSRAAVRADFHDDDAAFVHKFYNFGGGAMTLTDFGNGEVAHCSLDKVLQ
ncbi:MAG TPA: hypothetical protein VMU08_13465 [Rhizomicrobium sp.]|nr:hypothetical protein [Rhizomicrobium sp.]